MEQFFLALCLCHTAQIQNPDVRPLLYTAVSPDEKALVEALQRLKIAYANDDDDLIVLEILGGSRIFKRLEVLEFTSGKIARQKLQLNVVLKISQK